MKKKLSSVLALAVILTLTGCSQQDIPDTQRESVTAPLTDAKETVTENTLNTEKTEETTPPEETSLTGIEEAEPDVPTTAQTTAAETAAETAAPAPPATEPPAAKWKETQITPTTMYINAQGVYSRTEPIQGSARATALDCDQAVTVYAKTDTDYFKIENGSYVHSSFLSSEKAAAATTATEAATAAPPPVTEEAPAVIGQYGQRSQTQAEMDFADRVFELTNAQREKAGLPKLKKMQAITDRANIRAWELTINTDHQRPDGSRYYTVLNDMSYSESAENLAAGQATPEEVVNAWMNSEGHREHILSPNYEYLGIGYYNVEGTTYTHYWIQIFCK